MLSLSLPGLRALNQVNPSRLDAARFRQRPAGLTAQPTAACGSSAVRRRALGSGAASPAGFGAFALLDGFALTQFRVQGVELESLDLRGLGLGIGALGLGLGV